VREIFHAPPEQGTPVVLFLEARTPSEFAFRTLNAFAAFRGILNFALFNGWWRKQYAAKPSPYNYIYPGAIHTIHEPTGELVTTSFHYEAQFTRPFQSPGKPRFRSDLNAFVSECLSDILDSPDSGTLLDFFAEYALALDNVEPSQTFRDLWTLLEHITGSEPGKTHTQSDIVKRVCFISQDPNRTRIEMKHLCRKRNNAVHGSEKPTDWKNVVNQLKLIVDDVFEFLIAVPELRTRSLQELFHLMDHPCSADEIGDLVRSTEQLLVRRRAALEIRQEIDELRKQYLNQSSNGITDRMSRKLTTTTMDSETSEGTL
jgi:hypothetical protein